MLLGFDTSHWKWPMEVQWLVDAGGQYLITKATDGSTFTDETFDDFRLQAEAIIMPNGKPLPFGGFHYFRCLHDTIVQAERYHSVADGVLIKPNVDVEKANNYGLLPKAEFAARLREHLLVVEDLFGRRPMIYTSKYAWFDLCGEPAWLTEYDLWIANYGVTQPALPKPATKWVMWQWSESYEVRGKHYDADWFNGDQQQFEEWTGMTEEFPKTITINVKRNSIIQLNPNGKQIGLAPYATQLVATERKSDAAGKPWLKVGSGWIREAETL